MRKKTGVALAAFFFVAAMAFSAGTASAAITMTLEGGPYEVLVPCNGSATLEINGTVESTRAEYLEFSVQSDYASDAYVTPSTLLFPVGGGTQNITIVLTYTGPLPLGENESLVDSVVLFVSSVPVPKEVG